MNDAILLRIDGAVDVPSQLTFQDLVAVDDEYQIPDVSQYDSQRKGSAIRLEALLRLAKAKASAKYIGLHSSTDDFHASIPLSPVRERAMVIYKLDDQPRAAQSGGPVRFFIPDHAACHTDEIDECANVKFVDHIELTLDKGFDNRPEDDESHAKLHCEQA